MRNAIFAVVALLLVAGWINNSNAVQNGNRPKEQWLLDRIPTEVDRYSVRPEAVGSKVSYRMSEPTYKELDPIGIAAQRFSDGVAKGFDAVMIAGNNMESFHDQRWCFKAQGWDILREEVAQVQTKSYGAIPATIVVITRAGAPEVYALFTLKGPTKFHSNIPSAAKDFFEYELFKRKKFIGFFFRVIPEFTATREDVLKFAGDYIDSAHKSSNGDI